MSSKARTNAAQGKWAQLEKQIQVLTSAIENLQTKVQWLETYNQNLHGTLNAFMAVKPLASTQPPVPEASTSISAVVPAPVEVVPAHVVAPAPQASSIPAPAPANPPPQENNAPPAQQQTGGAYLSPLLQAAGYHRRRTLC